MAFSNEEESKKKRIFQREKRQELQLIIERCNEIPFSYVKVPSLRHDNVVFGSSKPRSIHFFAENKTVNSFMRRCFKEHFSEPSHVLSSNVKKSGETSEQAEQKLTHPFASKVPRFQEIIAMDSSQVYRRKKKVQEQTVTARVRHSAFGLAMNGSRELMITRDIKNDQIPLGSYVEKKERKNNNFPPAYEIVCSTIDEKCDKCEDKISNVYWKNSRNNSILCRYCYNAKILQIKNKSKSAIERYRNLEIMEKNYKKKRNCSFVHEHNNTKAHVYTLTAKEFKKRMQRENFLNSVLNY